MCEGVGGELVVAIHTMTELVTILLWPLLNEALNEAMHELKVDWLSFA